MTKTLIGCAESPAALVALGVVPVEVGVSPEAAAATALNAAVSACVFGKCFMSRLGRGENQ